MRLRPTLVAGLLLLAGAFTPALASEVVPLETTKLADAVQDFSGHYGAYMNGFSVGTMELQVTPAPKKGRSLQVSTDFTLGPVSINETQTVVVDRDWGLVSLEEARTGTQGAVSITGKVRKSELEVQVQGDQESEYAFESEGLTTFSIYRHLLANAPVPAGEARLLSLLTPASATVDEVYVEWIGPEEVQIRGEGHAATRIEVTKAGALSEVLWVADGHMLVSEDQASGLRLIAGTAEEVRQHLPEVSDPKSLAVRDSLTVVLVALTTGNGELLDKVVDYKAMLARATESGLEGAPTTLEEAREQMHGAMDQSGSGLSKAEAKSASRLFTIEVEGEGARAWLPTDETMVYELVDKGGVWRLVWLGRSPEAAPAP